MSRKERKQQMLELVKQWQQSGVSQKEFVALHQINVHIFRYWVHQARESPSTAEGFVELPTTGMGAPNCVRYPSGVELYLPALVPPHMLQIFIHF